MKIRQTYFHLLVTLTLACCAVFAVTVPQSLGYYQDLTANNKLEPLTGGYLDVTATTEVEYNCLSPFQNPDWEAVVSGLTFFSYETLFSAPVLNVISGNQNMKVTAWTHIRYGNPIWAFIGLMSLLIMAVSCWRNTSGRWSLMCFLCSYSALILVFRAIAAWWWPAAICVSAVIIAFWFSLPFIICRAAMSVNKLYVQLAIAIPALCVYFIISNTFAYLYYDLLWLILCVLPATAIFFRPYHRRVLVVLYLAAIYANFSFLSHALASAEIGLPVLFWSIGLNLSIYLSSFVNIKKYITI